MNKMPVLLVSCLLAGGCDHLSDTVTRNYPTLADARSDHLFGRGWLPDILPPSTTDIRTSNDLDSNTSVGEFSFKNGESSTFYSNLQPGLPTSSRIGSWSEIVDDYTNTGHTQWQYRDSDTTWVFFCEQEANRCVYYAWFR